MLVNLFVQLWTIPLNFTIGKIAVALNTNIGDTNATLRIRFSRVRIPRELRAGQRRWFSDIYGVRRVAARGKRGERIAYGRVELHDVDDDITRISLANVLSCPVKSLIAIEDRGSRGFDATSRFVLRGWKRGAGIGKIPVGLVLFSFRRCLSACSNKSLRVTVQRPQVSASWNASYVEPLHTTGEVQ